MKYIGVDACRKGWFAVSMGPYNAWEIEIFDSIGDLWDECQCNALILIDIPIGLPDNGIRECDVEARKLLKKRAASVFPVPCRQAIKSVLPVFSRCPAGRRSMQIRIRKPAGLIKKSWESSYLFKPGTFLVKSVKLMICYAKTKKPADVCDESRTLKYVSGRWQVSGP
jgi:hypothetical protein